MGGIMAFVMEHYQPRGQRGGVPDLRTDRAAWYQYWDEDGNGSLQKEEVVRALIKTFGIGNNLARQQNMRGALDAVWCIFDEDGSGSIEQGEFLMQDGLADTILASL